MFLLCQKAFRIPLLAKVMHLQTKSRANSLTVEVTLQKAQKKTLTVIR